MTDWDEDCLQWQGRKLTGAQAHYCSELDALPVDETCEVWPCPCHVGTIAKLRAEVERLRAMLHDTGRSLALLTEAIERVTK
jgi:hypothetical protein